MNEVLIPPQLSLSGRAPSVGSVLSLIGETMGTNWKCKIVANEERRDLIQQTVTNAFDTIVAQMSHWDSNSSLSKLNAAPLHTAIPLEHHFFLVLQRALEVSSRTQGVYNPTVGQIVSSYGFSPWQSDSQRMYTEEPWTKFLLIPETQSIIKKDIALLDLSSIAKGYAIDVVASDLLDLGFDHFLLEVGGEFRGEGCRPDHSPWWVEIDPFYQSPTLSPRVITALASHSLATSGRSENCHKHNPAIHHLIDPRHNAPASTALDAVSVLHPDCMEADVWATALYLVGEEEGIKLANDLNLCAIFFTRLGDEEVVQSHSLSYQAYLQE